MPHRTAILKIPKIPALCGAEIKNQQTMVTYRAASDVISNISKCQN